MEAGAVAGCGRARLALAVRWRVGGGAGRVAAGCSVGGVGVVLVALRALPFSALPCLPVAAARVSVSFLVVAVGLSCGRAACVLPRVFASAGSPASLAWVVFWPCLRVPEIFFLGFSILEEFKNSTPV